MIRPLTDWVFERALARLRPLVERGAPRGGGRQPLATDLLDTSFPAQCADVLGRRPGSRRQALVLEITERMVMADLTRAKASSQTLADIGRAGLHRRLRHRLLLAGLSERPGRRRAQDRPHVHRPPQAGEAAGRDEAIARSVIDLGHAVGLRVVAEGIERVEFMNRLAALGCDIGQGFAIQAPRPAEELDFDAVGEHVRAATGGINRAR